MTGTITLTNNTTALQRVPASSYQATVEGVQSEDPSPSDPIVVNWTDIVGKPTFGTAASRDVPAAGDATSAQVVLGTDSRLTDTRDTTAVQITDASNTGRDLLTALGAPQALSVLGGSITGQALFTAPDALSGRNTLGLGTISTQNANNVTLTGGSITGITDLAVADGGTGASTAAAARTNLGSTTVGDAVFIAASAAAARAALGSTTVGDALLIAASAAAARSTLVVSQVGPAFSAHRTSDQSLTASAFNEVVFNGEDFDTDNAFNTSNGRFTPQVAGKYQLSACVSMHSTTTLNNVQILLYKNGTVFRRGDLIVPPSTTSDVGLTVTALVDANGSSDYFSIYAYPGSSGTLTVDGSNAANSWFTGHFVRA